MDSPLFYPVYDPPSGSATPCAPCLPSARLRRYPDIGAVVRCYPGYGRRFAVDIGLGLMSRNLWRALILCSLAPMLAALFAFVAQNMLGCVGEAKSYRACYIAGKNVAHWIFGLQFWSFALFFYLCIPFLLLSLAAESVFAIRRRRKQRTGLNSENDGTV